MNVPNLWTGMLFFIVYLGQMHGYVQEDNIDSKEYFCGKKLVRTLTELCLIYNSPDFAHARFRRQIVQECCRSQCSRRYLVQYYCSQANSSIVDLLKVKPSEETESKDYQSDDARIAVSDEREPVTVGTISEEGAINRNALISGAHLESSSYNNKITDRKRHCKCRKRREKRMKKLQKMQQLRSNRYGQNSVPPPNIGQVEDSQGPFYVWKFSRVV